eukprot:COSAG04_NODE_4197_length_2240_cov_1.105091_2_plen_235_part_00
MNWKNANLACRLRGADAAVHRRGSGGRALAQRREGHAKRAVVVAGVQGHPSRTRGARFRRDARAHARRRVHGACGGRRRRLALLLAPGADAAQRERRGRHAHARREFRLHQRSERVVHRLRALLTVCSVTALFGVCAWCHVLDSFGSRSTEILPALLLRPYGSLLVDGEQLPARDSPQAAQPQRCHGRQDHGRRRGRRRRRGGHRLLQDLRRRRRWRRYGAPPVQSARAAAAAR